MVTRQSFWLDDRNIVQSLSSSFTAVDGSVINTSHSASNIGVIFDNNLNMERQVVVVFLELGSSRQLKAPKC